MRTKLTYKALLILFLLIGIISSAQAQHTMTGELAVDLKGFNFKNNYESVQLLDTLAVIPDSTRRNTNLSSHYLNLFFNGPFINTNFANYMVRTKINGSFFNSTSQNTVDGVFQKSTENQYIKPEINNFYGKLSIFPNRKFPMEIYHSESDEHNIQYEANNRTYVELVDPASGVVRHYFQDRSSDGYSVYYGANQNLKLQSTVKKDETNSSRVYDFGVDKDIYLLPIAERGTAFTSDRYNLTLVNDLPDASLEIILENVNSGAFTIYTISPNLSETVLLDSGNYIIEVASIPSIYNKIGRSRLNVNQDMTLRYSFIEPSTPNDVKQTLNSVNLGLTYDNNERFKSVAFYEYSDQKEGFQNLATYLNNFNNSATYSLGDNSDIASQTNIIRNQTDVDTTSHQVSTGFLQSFMVNHLMKNGVFSNFSYSYNYSKSSNRVDSITGIDTVTSEPTMVDVDEVLSSNTHILSNKYSIPHKSFYNHTMDFGLNMNFLNDNTGFNNSQYTYDMKNNFSKQIGLFKFEPRNDTKYSTSSQETVIDVALPAGGLKDSTQTSASKEIESRFYLKTFITNNKIVGDVTTGLEYGYRKKFSDENDDIKNKYVFNINVIKKFNKAIKMSFLISREKEFFTVFTVDSLAGDFTLSKSRVDKKGSAKIDLTLTPWEEFTFSAGYMIITQTSTDDFYVNSLIERGSQINKLNFSLDFKVPYLKLPVKMFYTKDTRDIDPVKLTVASIGEFDEPGSKSKSNFNVSLTTKISYQFRKISLVLSHEYKKEEESSVEGYSIHEINGKITRRFGIF